MVKKNITGLPVVNDDMSLAGIISRKDSIKHILELRHKDKDVS